LDLAAFARGVLDHHHRIGAFGDWGASHDFDALANANPNAAGVDARLDLADVRKESGNVGYVSASNGKSVPGGSAERRKVSISCDRLCEDAFVGVKNIHHFCCRRMDVGCVLINCMARLFEGGKGHD
jgi:hypothetical protein